MPRSRTLFAVIPLALSLAACSPKPPAAPPPPAVTVAPRARARHRRVGRVQRPARGGGPGGDPAPRVGLHQARDVHRRARGPEGRGALRDRSPAVPGRAGARRRPSWSRRAPRADWPQREVQRAEKLVNSRPSRARSSTAGPAPRPTASRPCGRRRPRSRPRGSTSDWTAVRSPIAGRVSRARGDRGQPGAGRAARRDPAHHRGLARLHLSLLRQRRADLSALLRPRGSPRASRLARRALPRLPRAGQRDRLPPRGPAGLRGQPDRPRQRDHPHPRDLLQPRPPVHPGALRPGQAGGQQAAPPRCWCGTRPSAPTRTASSCWSSARATAWSTGRSRSAAWPTACASCARASKPASKVVVNGLMRVRPGMKVTPTVVAMVPDSSARHRAIRPATVAER